LASTKSGLIEVYFRWKANWIFGCAFIFRGCRMVLANFKKWCFHTWVSHVIYTLMSGWLERYPRP
ncbi:hypothetical protein, partial [Staphylococcus pseudintermedius]